MNPQVRFIFFILIFIWILSTPTGNIDRYPSSIDRSYILQQFQNEINISRNALISDYELGYGNLTGLHLSYQDAIENRNISRWPFLDRKGPFIEEETYSILPNLVSRKAANVWNFEGNNVKLPSTRLDNSDEIIGSKINLGDYPLNISGSLRGEFKKLNLTEIGKKNLVPIHMPLPNYMKTLFDFRSRERRNKEEENKYPDYDDNLQQNQERLIHEGDHESHNEEDFGSLDVDLLPPDDHFKKIGNFTEDNGLARLSFTNIYPNHPIEGVDQSDTTLVDLNLKLSDVSEADEHILSLSGLYYQDNGNILVSTRSAKFAGPYSIPQLTLESGSYFDKAKWTLLSVFNETKIDNLKFQLIEELVDHSDRCEYIGYFHMESTNLTKDELKQIDYELKNPVGRPHKSVPELKLSSGLLYSPNCAIILDLGTAKGVRSEISDYSLRKTMIVASVVVLFQIWLLIRQMAQTNTPSTLSRLSFWTISLINMADGTLSVISLLSSMVYDELYIQFSVCSFLAFTCSAIYEMKYGVQIYCTQINERPLDWRTMLQGTPVDERAELRDQNLNDNPTAGTGNNANNNNNNNNTATPAPTTATTATTAATADEQAVGAELYTRHFFAMLVFLFVLINVVTWPRKQRLVFEYIFITIFNSFWIPQIYRNVLRGSRTSFTWEFMLGMSALRLIPIIYIDIFTNSFHHHKDIGFVIFLFFWMSLQLFVLFLQEILGPRFFLSDKYLPKTYNYHPIISKGDVESGFNLDAEEIVSDGSSADEDSRTLKYVTDCAICMQKVEIPIVDSNQLHSHTEQFGSNTPPSTGLGFAKGTANIIARRKYMVTPCNHVFHTDCLENWMMYKLQCPVCRNSLPPF
ncbi:hypothetical protein C6P42_002972 [Pichia californica]|nr:hypothetical protein C6P42_002972 [[Candida] californica]